MAQETSRHARIGARAQTARSSAMGFRGTLWWLTLRTIAAVLGVSGWLYGITGAFLIALGVAFARWGKRFKDAADAARFEA